MRIVLSVLLVVATLTPASNYLLERPLHVGGDPVYCQYDDGSAYWLTWGGLYRGTWFDAEDFWPGISWWDVWWCEFWFYHHSSYPWDTASFYCEVYNGGISLPATQLAQTSAAALHYSPCYVDYDPSVETETQFWILVNTEMSSGGWPSLLGDNTPNTEYGNHSLFSDDFVVWEPWVIQGPVSNDYFIREECSIGLAQTTWGSIKTLF